MRIKSKANCPISASLDLLGDRWTLVVLRDILLARTFSFSEIGSNEGIATNILNNRLERLMDSKLIERFTDPLDKRRKIYLPKEQGIKLIPVLVELIIWGDDNTTARGQKELAYAIKNDREAIIQNFENNIRSSMASIKKLKS